MKNLIKNQITQAEQDQVLDLLSQIEAILGDKLVALTEEERKRYGSINEQNKLMVNKVKKYHDNVPELSSPDVDWDEFNNDYNTRGFLETIMQRFNSLGYRSQSTKILHDYDNHQDALDDYGFSQYKKGAGAPGAAEKVAELSQFFNRTGTKNKTEPQN